MRIDETTRNALHDELRKIAAGMARLGSMPQTAETVAKKTQFLGAVRKSFRPRNLMKTSSAVKAMALGAGTLLGTAGSVAAIKTKKKVDDERLKQMRRAP